MTVIERKRSADMVASAVSAEPDTAQTQHPCFWAVLDGESLNFVFVSASLHVFLGDGRTSATMNQSLFDYIHPEEANAARRDLANTFISKSFVGSSTRRFDLEKTGIQHVFRRASESQILLRGRSSQHIHESFERKLSLPIIPDIVKLRANGSQPLSPSTPSGLNQPMPKRLRTILEDSVGSFAPADNGGAVQPADGITSSSSNNNNSGTSRLEDDNKEYLIANIGLFLVSARLFVMVCHYEEPPPEGLLPTPEAKQHLPAKGGPEPQSPAARCDCAANNAPIIPDSERVRQLISQVQKVDVINAAQRFVGAASSTSAMQGASGGSAPNKGGTGGGGSGGGSSSLSSRHVQLYSVNTEQLLCAFPEDAYQRIYGKAPADAVSSGTGLRGLWEHCRDKRTKTHAMSLLQGPCVPNTNPIRLELQVRPGGTDALADVQSMFFRWGHLLFVCQQMRGDHTPELSTIGGIGVDDNILASYNLSTPPSDDPSRSGTALDTTPCTAHNQQPVTSGNGSICSSSNRSAVCNSSPLNPGAASETRPFSLSRAPASVVASLPPRATPMQAPVPAETAPPRRQSSYTLPPVKSFEERRFSYPTQSMYTDRRPPPLPIPQ
ncbi:hypothetical protein GGF43_004272, partial [Coemansia sp. RSA 2618]